MMGGIHGASKRGNRRSHLHGTGLHECISELDRPPRWWNDRKLGSERIGPLSPGAALYAGTWPEMARKTQFRGAPRLTLTDSSRRPDSGLGPPDLLEFRCRPICSPIHRACDENHEMLRK